MLSGRPSNIRILTGTEKGFKDGVADLSTFFTTYKIAFAENTALQLWVPFQNSENHYIFPEKGGVTDITYQEDKNNKAWPVNFASPDGVELMTLKGRIYRFLFNTPDTFDPKLAENPPRGRFMLDLTERLEFPEHPRLISASTESVILAHVYDKKLGPTLRFQYGKK